MQRLLMPRRKQTSSSARGDRSSDQVIGSCEQCGQLVDRHDLDQVIWHGMPGHEPLEMDG